MVYMGSKRRLAKELIPIITADLKEGTYYVEPFCGGCNMIDKINHPLKIASDSNKFWQWVREKTQEGHKVFVSEYQAPEDFICIWQKEQTKNLGTKAQKTVEKLFIWAN